MLVVGGCKVRGTATPAPSVQAPTVPTSTSAATTAAPPAKAATKKTAQTPSAGVIDLAHVRIVDMSHTFDKNTIYWPTSPSTFEFKVLSKGKTKGGFHYEANTFCTPEHGGTHLDAPVHFAEGAQSTDNVPLRRLMGPAVVFDVRSSAAANPDYQLSLADVKAWEARHGPIPEAAIALLHTGWGARWPDRKAYLGDDTPGDASNLHFPSFGREAADYLIRQRKVAVIGVDTASIDPGNSRDFPVHQVAGKANVAGLENVANLDQLPATGAMVMALPMKIGGGSGGPARIVGFVPTSTP